MSASTRSVLAVVGVLALAGLAYAVWQRFFSHEAQIASVHAACLAEFDAGKAKVKSALPSSSAPKGDAVGDAVNDAASGVGRLIDRVAGGITDATCGALREACRFDFDGEACVRARARYR